MNNFEPQPREPQQPFGIAITHGEVEASIVQSRTPRLNLRQRYRPETQTAQKAAVTTPKRLPAQSTPRPVPPVKVVRTPAAPGPTRPVTSPPRLERQDLTVEVRREDLGALRRVVGSKALAEAAQRYRRSQSRGRSK